MYKYKKVLQFLCYLHEVQTVKTLDLAQVATYAKTWERVGNKLIGKV